jgi:UPF0176 protein
MSVLVNRVSHAEMRQRLLRETEPRTTISFYRYVQIEEPQAFRDALFLKLDELKVFGRIYVAREGINAQISVPASRFEALKQYLDSLPGLENLRLNVAVDDDGKSFFFLKIKVREKIVADGLPNDFNPSSTGRYLNAAAFNAMASNPDTVIVDMRNHYEYEVGHFKNAIEVPSETFREQLPMAADMLKDKKDKPIVMYCTGGIRCEKATAYMIQQGFRDVYHVEGGIIHYARTAREQQLPNLFIGKNFVFDERLGERISDDVIAHCHQCGKPCDTHTNCANDACHLLFIQCDECREKMKNCCSEPCMEIAALPEEERALIRKGQKTKGPMHSKSRDGMSWIRRRE